MYIYIYCKDTSMESQWKIVGYKWLFCDLHAQFYWDIPADSD